MRIFTIMQDCGMSCIKYLLFTFNCLFALSGIVLAVIGGIVLHDVDRFRTFLKISFLAPPVVFIVVGVIVFVVSLVGCCGAIKESSLKLACFAGLLFLIFASEIGVGILAAANKDTFIREMKKSMKSSKDNYDSSLPQDKKIWDEIQSGLQCCGVDGPKDWHMGGRWPASCCEGYDPKLHKDHLCTLKEYVWQIGCFDKLKQIISDETYIVLGVGFGVAFLQITGIILACVLASEINNERNKEGRPGN